MTNAKELLTVLLLASLLPSSEAFVAQAPVTRPSISTIIVPPAAAAATARLSPLFVAGLASDDDHRHSSSSDRRLVVRWSLTAVRASLRALTGVSLTTLYVASYTVMGAWLRQSIRGILSLVPPSWRSFFQPLLIGFYAPLFILRNLTGPGRRRGEQRPVPVDEEILQGWTAAIEKAEESMAYWPLELQSPDEAAE